MDTAPAYYLSNIRKLDAAKYKRWLKYCADKIPVGRNAELGRDALAHFFYAKALHIQGDGAWMTYRSAMFDQLQSSQNKDGSWPASEGISAGPLYSTALWCTILQLDNDNHPSQRRRDMIIK